MSVEHTTKVMEGYWSGHNPGAVAADAVFMDVASGQSEVFAFLINEIAGPNPLIRC